MLPNNILSDYLERVEQAILKCKSVYVERYEEEILTSSRANLRIRLRFSQNHLLEINEAILISENGLNFLDYRYHFQDAENRLIFRYDSTPHFPNLPKFPYHKHIPNDVIDADKPDIALVLMEARKMRESSGNQ
jgi:Family of unknown function (DUF6516)